MAVLRISVDNLGSGALPTYSLPAGWTFPVYHISSDGQTILRSTNIERITLSTFEISGTKETIKDRIANILTSLVMTAKFAGRVIIAVCSDYVISIPDVGPMMVVEVGVMFTVDWLEELAPGIILWEDSPSWKPDALPEIEAAADDLQDGFTAVQVMLS